VPFFTIFEAKPFVVCNLGSAPHVLLSDVLFELGHSKSSNFLVEHTSLPTIQRLMIVAVDLPESRAPPTEVIARVVWTGSDSIRGTLLFSLSEVSKLFEDSVCK
jgi:hypothetical protein